MTTSTRIIVNNEVESLHDFLVGWFSGATSKECFQDEFLNRFDREFLLVPPSGKLLNLAELAESIHAAYASNPEFRIEIRNTKVRRIFGNKILATYEEWQRNALASSPADNGRIATALFQRAAPLRWLHIHETWLPEAQTRADAYDF